MYLYRPTTLLVILLYALVSYVKHACAQFSPTISLPVSPTTSKTDPTVSPAFQRMNCQAIQIYEHPDVTASYAVPAVEEIDGVVVNSLKSWNLTAAVGQTGGMYDDTTQAIQRNLLLDVSSTFSDSDGESKPLAFAACAFILSLSPQSSKDDSGDCSNVFSSACVSDLKSAMAVQASKIAKSENASNVCDSFTHILDGPPPSCKKYTDKKSGVLGSGRLQYSYLDFSQDSLLSPSTCSSSTSRSTQAPQSMLPIFTQNLLLPTTPLYLNSTLMTQASLTTPVIMALFSNSSVYHGPAYSDARIICTRPSRLVGAENSTAQVPAAGDSSVHSGAIEDAGTVKTSGASSSSAAASGGGAAAVIGGVGEAKGPLPKWLIGSLMALGVNAIVFFSL